MNKSFVLFFEMKIEEYHAARSDCAGYWKKKSFDIMCYTRHEITSCILSIHLFDHMQRILPLSGFPDTAAFIFFFFFRNSFFIFRRRREINFFFIQTTTSTGLPKHTQNNFITCLFTYTWAISTGFLNI